MGNLAFHKLTQEYDTEEFKLGDIVEEGKNKYVFVKSAAAIATGQLVTIDQDGVATEGTTTTAAKGRGAGVTKFAFSAADKYGFVQTRGAFQLDCATGLSEGDKLFTSATAGRVGTDGGSDVRVNGLYVTADTSTAGLATCEAAVDMWV